MLLNRYSLQREKIYQIVRESKEHPTSEMVFASLKPELPKLSLGTVYRNLHQMAQDGRLQELPGPTVRIDCNTKPHAHFTCEACGKVSDVEIPYDAGLDFLAGAGGCQVTSHALMFYGVCPQCAEKQEKKA